MKFKIITFREAVQNTPEDMRTAEFNTISFCFGNLIKDKILDRKIFMNYIHSLARTLNGGGEKNDIEIIQIYENRMVILSRKRDLNWDACKDFFYALAESVYESRYETVDGQMKLGSDIDNFEAYNNLFDEDAWMKKHKIIF